MGPFCVCWVVGLDGSLAWLGVEGASISFVNGWVCKGSAIPNRKTKMPTIEVGSPKYL